MIIINSAAYVISEFQSEFGKIPPSMLPLGNRKLIEHQIETLRTSFPDDSIILSLPASFEVSMMDVELSPDYSVVYVPDFFSLSEAILYILNTVDIQDNSIRLLHGDTLFEDYPVKLDVISVSGSNDDYTWEVDSESDDNLVWSGFFSFSSSKTLIKSLALSKGKFVDAVKYYKANLGVTSYLVNEWYDLGHVNTYFKSRSKITTQRSFNSLNVSEGVVVKTGEPAIKIFSEGLWFDSLPASLKKYVPQLIDRGENDQNKPFYAIEYLPNSPLNEVYVHGKNSSSYWNRIFKLSAGFMLACRENSSKSDSELMIEEGLSLYKDKSIRRLTEYLNTTSLDVTASFKYDGSLLPSLKKILDDCINKTLNLPLIPSILHGDLCFSNILFDSRSNAIKVIDPRALNEQQEFMLQGDQKYDLAKLSHSVVGMYDFIIAGRYKIECKGDGEKTIKFYDEERILHIQNKFIETEFIPGINTLDIMPLTILLFLSMLPLHSDKPSRQEAMLLNAMRLYKTYIYDVQSVKSLEYTGS